MSMNVNATGQNPLATGADLSNGSTNPRIKALEQKLQQLNNEKKKAVQEHDEEKAQKLEKEIQELRKQIEQLKQKEKQKKQRLEKSQSENSSRLAAAGRDALHEWYG
ncbi:hypothetical protein AALB16_00935 [Lachnospiraceae bacterium 62-35]